tara:strand:+ start:1351 stop:1620 length:270 start_codon:yes stop_codon:yes gene_type:complete
LYPAPTCPTVTLPAADRSLECPSTFEDAAGAAEVEEWMEATENGEAEVAEVEADAVGQEAAGVDAAWAADAPVVAGVAAAEGAAVAFAT